MQANGFPTKSSSTSVKFLIEALMEEVKPVVAEKNLENRDVSILIDFSESSDYHDYEAKRKSTNFLMG